MLLLSSDDFFLNLSVTLSECQTVICITSIRVFLKVFFGYFSTKAYVVGIQKNHLSEHPKCMFKLMDKKIFAIYTQNFAHHKTQTGFLTMLLIPYIVKPL